MINKPRRPDGPVDESNRHLSKLMAGMPAPPQDGPKRAPFPWGFSALCAATTAAFACAAYWVLAR
jgi:hypothetical protein